MPTLIDSIRSLPRPYLVGMLHVPALPGSPDHSLDLAAIRERILSDAALLAQNNFDALMLENFGDIPFYPGRVPHETVAYLTTLAAAVRQQFSNIPLGINALRNDGLSALAIAHATGAAFIRVNVLAGARVTDQGVIQGIAHDLLRLRKNLNAKDIAIFADVDVKHSTPLGPPRPIADEVDDLAHRAGADALIVSGQGTGKPTDQSKLAAVKQAAGQNGPPIFVGSGITQQSAPQLAPHCHGFIVGSTLKFDSNPNNPVDPARAKSFSTLAHTLKRA